MSGEPVARTANVRALSLRPVAKPLKAESARLKDVRD